MPFRHAAAIQRVCDDTGHAIIFRAVGKQGTRLLEEGYAAKGFRIDTKSCDWGPMRGFVCVDPRLSKVGGDDAKALANQRYTVEALEGGIRHDAIGGLDPADVANHAILPDWQSGCKPIVLSSVRVHENEEAGVLGAPNAAGILRGVSNDRTGRVQLPWALIPVARCTQVPGFAARCGQPPVGGYGLFVDFSNPVVRFAPWRPNNVDPIRVLGYEAILGLTNPGTDEYGYRACVTGDYDLFAVWAPQMRLDPFAARRGWDVRVVDRHRARNAADPTPHHHQHYKLGNITPRLNMIKVLLNTALISRGAFPGGNLVHHSDEVGNPSPGLRKTLMESFPLLAFVPSEARASAGWRDAIMCLRNTLDFATFVTECQRARIVPDLRPEWRLFAQV